MKIISAVLLLCLSINFQITRCIDERNLIKQFLMYAKSPNKSLDTILTSFIKMDTMEYQNATREQRKEYIWRAFLHLSDNLRHISLDSVRITGYDNAEESLQTLDLDEEHRLRAFIAYSPNHTFKRYFLLKGEYIESFVLYADKAFLILD